MIDLHGEYATAFPNNTQLIEADKVELPYWLLNFEEFQDLAVDVTEFTAHNQITGLRDALHQARQNTDKAEKLGLGNAVTVDSPIYFDLQEMLQQIHRNYHRERAIRKRQVKGRSHQLIRFALCK